MTDTWREAGLSFGGIATNRTNTVVGVVMRNFKKAGQKECGEQSVGHEPQNANIIV